MSEYGKTKKTRRILAAAMSLAMLLTTISSLTLNADEADGAAEDKRVADRSTADSYESFLNIAEDTLDAGRVWTDKSVYALDGVAGGYSVDIDGAAVTYDVTSDADFLEVFSALGSSVAVNGDEDVPLDVMFLLDMSGSMGGSTDGSVEKTRLAYAVDAMNEAFDFVLNQNVYNRVGLCLYGGDGYYDQTFWNYYLGRNETDTGNGLPVLGLGRYTAKDNGKGYFSVGGYGNPLAPTYRTGAMGQVWMSVDVNEGTLIDGKMVHDVREWSGNTTSDGLMEITGCNNTDTSKDYELKTKIRAAGATHTQMGLYTAMDMLANENKTTTTVNGKTVTRTPVLILITDGIPTVSYSGSDWWEPNGYDVQGPGGAYYYGNYMLAMATASYMKQRVNERYYGTANPTGETSALIYTFGIDLTKTGEKEIADAFLNPKEEFYSDTDTATQIREAWEKYQQGLPVDVQINKTAGGRWWTYDIPAAGIATAPNNDYMVAVQSDKPLYDAYGAPCGSAGNGSYWVNPNSKYWDVAPNPGANGYYSITRAEKYYPFVHPTGDDIDTLIYNDDYRNVPSEELNTALQDVLKSIRKKVTVPIKGYNDLTGKTGEESMLSYYDPIGEYMDVKDILKLRLFDEEYDIDCVNGSYYIVDPTDGAEIVNPSYGKDGNVTFRLSDFVIEVESETVNGLKREVLRVDIPATALPVWTVTADCEISNGNTVVKSYTTNIKDGSNNTAILPLRLFYTVGMQNEYMKDGSIDLTRISPEYKELHRNNETGRVYFYSNYYSSSPYIYNGGKISQRGDAYTTFSPADNNRFYIYQDYLPLYTDKDHPESSRVDDYNDTAGTYYFDLKYYTSDGSVGIERITHTGAMFGSGVPGDSQYGDFLVWYNPDTEEVADFTPNKPGGSWIAATKAGGIRVGDMGYLSGDSLKLAGNNTDTSGTYYLPTVSGNTITDNVIITNYLGNNGVRSSDDVSLLITKQVESDKNGFEAEDFGFTVTIPSMADRTLNAVEYQLYSDGGSSYWLRLAETKVDVSDSNGYLVTTEGEVTDMKVTDSTVTVSPDGKQGTVMTEGGEETVYEVTVAQNGSAEYTYYYMIDLQPRTVPVKFDGSGKANITLKHGKGLLFYGLENEDISVTETLTEAQFKDDYRFKMALDESGALLPVQFDNQSYTAEKTLESTDKANNFARNEIHWFNKTVKFDKDETQAKGADVVTTPDPDDEKIHHGPELKVGDSITYTISWANDAMETVPNTVPEKKKPVAAEVTITDKLDDGVKYISADSSAGGSHSYDETTHTVTWTIDAQAGESGTVTLTVEVTPKALEKNKVGNKAHIAVENGSQVDTKTIDNPVEAPVIEILKKQSVNGGDKTVERQRVNGEDEVTYFITVKNTGSAEAKDVVITDDIPAGLTLGKINDGGERIGDTIVWKIGALASGAEREVSYTVKVPEVEEYTEWTNIAYASFENDPENPIEPDPNDPHHKDRKRRPSNEVVIDEGAPALKIEKTQAVNDGEQTKEKQTVKGGDEVTYYIKVTNTGSIAAEDVVVTDGVPEGLTLGTINDGGELIGNTIVWEIGELEVKGSVTVSFTVTVPEVKEYTVWKNIAELSFGNDPEDPPEEPDDPADEPTEPDPDDPHRNRKRRPSNEVVIVEGAPVLEIEKTQAVNDGEQTKEKQTVKGGDEVTYFIKVTNTGDVTAEDVIVTDEIPDGLTLVTVNDGGERLGDTIVWKIDSLAAGADVTVSFTVTVPEVEEHTEWTNIAEVSFGNDPDNPPEDTDDPDDPNDPHRSRNRKPSNEVVIDEGVPELDIEKTQAVNNGAQTKDKLTVNSGDTVKYCIKVTNTGIVDAEGVVVTDEVPDGLKLGSIGNNGRLLDDRKTIVWEIGTLAAGASSEVSFTVTAPTVYAYTQWTNVAAESFANNPENPSDDPENPTQPDPNAPHKGRTPKDSNEVVIEEFPAYTPGPTYTPTPETTTSELTTETTTEPEETTAEETTAEETTTEATTTEPPVTETAPPLPPPATSDNNFNLDDDGNPRGDMNIPTEDDRFNLDDDGNPRGNMNLPTGVVVGGGVAGLAAGSLIVAAVTQAVGKRRRGRKNK